MQTGTRFRYRGAYFIHAGIKFPLNYILHYNYAGELLFAKNRSENNFGDAVHL
jgi:hypothetical protein